MSRGLGNANAQGVIAPPHERNEGLWTVTFDARTIGILQSEYECYRIVITGPPGSSFQIYIGLRLYDNVTPGDKNSWDPNHTMKLTQGDTVHFFWDTSTAPAPTVTMYFQEPEIL